MKIAQDKSISLFDHMNSSWILHGKLMQSSFHGITIGNSCEENLVDCVSNWFMELFKRMIGYRAIPAEKHLKPTEGFMDVPWRI